MAIIDFLKKQFIDDHRVDGRLARHPLVPVPRRGQGDQERRAAHRARVAGGAVRLPRPVRRHLRPGQAHADHRQHPDPHHAQELEVRLESAVQGRRLLRHHPPLHRQQVGHRQPGDDARRRLRHRAAARLRHLRLPHRRHPALPQGGRRHGPPFPPRRIRRHHALAHRQRVQRRARQREGPRARRRRTLRRAGRGAAAADQPGDQGEVRPGDDQLRGRERLRAARGGAGHRQALVAWPPSAISTTT